jgi:hypothetical protein
MTGLDVENPLLSEQNKLFQQWYVGRFSTKPRVTVPQALRWKTSLPWEEIDEAYRGYSERLRDVEDRIRDCDLADPLSTSGRWISHIPSTGGMLKA